MADLISYYRERAREYEKIYEKPERQSELFRLKKTLKEEFRNKQVLEYASGTGYWTEKIAKTAKKILAVDINEDVIKIARKKVYPPDVVSFKRADIFKFNDLSPYESLFGGFIWSHIGVQDLDSFIETTNNLVNPGGTVIFIDNNYVAGSSTPIAGSDKFGNTYQIRELENGTSHRVLKNFPSEESILRRLLTKTVDINFTKLEYYWILKYRIK